MKKVLLTALLLMVVFACSTNRGVVKETKVGAVKAAPPATAAQKTSSKVVISPEALGKEELPVPAFGVLLSDVKISETSFNPSLGKTVTLFYKLAEDARVTVDVYDPDHGLVKRLVETQLQKAGANEIEWDGQDMDGNVVPDEAYFFTVEAQAAGANKEIYDPTTFSGGIENDITKADIHHETGTLIYRMPEMGRVCIRQGTIGGPLFNNLVDWQPRVAGQVTEYWDGRDKDGIMDLHDHKLFKMVISYYSLPENSVITYGNKQIDFKHYKKQAAASRPVKEKRGRTPAAGKISLHWKQLRVNDYEPRISVKFMQGGRELTDDVPVIQGKTQVRVELDESNKYFANQQYEICFFLDGSFYAEEEVGYAPFNWVWNTKQVKEGEHIFTVNISGFKDQIGIMSRKIVVKK